MDAEPTQDQQEQEEAGQDLSDDALDAELEEDDEDRDFESYAKTHADKLDAETRELLDVVKGPDVDSIEFAELTAAQLADLSDARFGEYLAWRETGALSIAEINELEVETRQDEERPVPIWGSEVTLSEKDFQASLRALEGSGFDTDSAAGDES